MISEILDAHHFSRILGLNFVKFARSRLEKKKRFMKFGKMLNKLIKEQHKFAHTDMWGKRALEQYATHLLIYLRLTLTAMFLSQFCWGLSFDMLALSTIKEPCNCKWNQHWFLALCWDIGKGGGVGWNIRNEDLLLKIMKSFIWS